MRNYEPLARPDLRHERIACSAIYHNDRRKHGNQPRNIKTGYVTCGLRHSNCWGTKAAATDLGPSEVRNASGDIVNISKTKGYTKPIQGFLTTHNRFLTREESAKVAYLAGQIGDWKPGDSLASEELY
jgi:hypothetical protein